MASFKPTFTLRLAHPEDTPSLRELIALSVRRLQSPDYSREQIEGSLEGTQGVDTRLRPWTRREFARFLYIPNGRDVASRRRFWKCAR
jgi:hypothetical protein